MAELPPRCHACNGSKKLMGMGLIVKDCYVCDGVGYLAQQRTHEADTPVQLAEPAHAPMAKPDKRSKAWRDKYKAKL